MSLITKALVSESQISIKKTPNLMDMFLVEVPGNTR